MSSIDRVNIDAGTGALLTGPGLDATLLPSTSYAVGTTVSTNLITVGSGVVIVINATAVGGAGSVVTTVQGYDAASGVYYPLLVSAALTTNTFQVLTIAPAIAVTANVSANMVTPRQIRVSCVITGNAVTFSVGASVIAA